MRMSRIAAVLIVPAFALITALPAGAEARVTNLTAWLNGHNEISRTTGEPGAGDPDGVGVAHVKVFEHVVCWEYRTERIGTPVAAHIHMGAEGVNGPVVVPFATNRGCLEVGRDLARAIRENPSSFYANVHTADYPAGAIRGQLQRVA